MWLRDLDPRPHSPPPAIRALCGDCEVRRARNLDLRYGILNSCCAKQFRGELLTVFRTPPDRSPSGQTPKLSRDSLSVQRMTFAVGV
jgi:hypothetical protein